MSSATTTAPSRSGSADPGENTVLAIYRAFRERRWLSLTIPPVIITVLAFLLYDAITAPDLNTFEANALSLNLLERQLVQHIDMTVQSTAGVILIAVPLGVLLTRPSARKIAEPILAVASGGQAIPAYGLLVLLGVVLGLGFQTSVIALIAYSILPVLRNTMVGLNQVDASTIEAARGMGLSRMQVLRTVELPLAVPVILAGVRTALIINVGTAALATFIGGGGLGETIVTGLKLQQDFILFTGSAITALLAMTIDWLAAVFEYTFSPRGLR